jgi:hypothetical protein
MPARPIAQDATAHRTPPADPWMPRRVVIRRASSATCHARVVPALTPAREYAPTAATQAMIREVWAFFRVFSRGFGSVRARRGVEGSPRPRFPRRPNTCDPGELDVNPRVAGGFSQDDPGLLGRICRVADGSFPTTAPPICLSTRTLT